MSQAKGEVQACAAPHAGSTLLLHSPFWPPPARAGGHAGLLPQLQLHRLHVRSAPCLFSSPGPSGPPPAGGKILNCFRMLAPAPTQADVMIGCEPAVTLSSTAHAQSSACATPPQSMMSRSALYSLRRTRARRTLMPGCGRPVRSCSSLPELLSGQPHWPTRKPKQPCGAVTGCHSLVETTRVPS
jgi:hypothetical protein